MTMAERETEHVRLVDAGRLRVSDASAVSVSATKSHFLVHGNAFGTGFVATATGACRAARWRVLSVQRRCSCRHTHACVSITAGILGFAVTASDTLEAAGRDYVNRKQEAIDHGQNATHVALEPLPTRRNVQLSAPAHALALSADELLLAVAYGSQLAVYEVAELQQSVGWLVVNRHCRL